MMPIPPHSNAPAESNDEASIRAQLAELRERQQRLQERMHGGQQHFQRLARSVWRVQEDERRRLARELNDGIGQNLTALTHQLDALLRMAPAQPDVQARAQAALALCASALADTRALSRMLRPQILDDLGLAAALRWLARSLGEGAGFSAELAVDALPEQLDPELSTLLFRIAQEALTNVARHAQAQHVLIRAGLRDRQLQLLIADDGRGCVAPAALDSGSQGLSTGIGGMRERLALFGGTLQFASEPGAGTRVRASVPYPAAAGAA